MICRFVLGFAATLIIASPSFAQGKGGGNGGGGGSSPEYTVVDLDNRPGLVSSWVTDVTKIGGNWFCAGRLTETAGDQAVIWEVIASGSGYAVDTHNLTGGEFAAGINELGECVGSGGSTFDPVEQVWVYSGLYWSSLTANPLVLAPLAGDDETDASGINADGVIVGRSTRRYFDGSEIVEDQTAVAWRAVIGQSGIEIRGPFVLGPQPNTYSARDARAVNDCDAAGIAQAVGITELGPVAWEVQCLTNGDLAVLSGPDSLVPAGTEVHGSAEGINNNGDACGRNIGQGFRRLADGTLEPLATPRNAFSEAAGINGSRQVVGQVRDPRKGTYGVLWQADGSRVDLNKYLGRNSPWHRIWWGTTIDSEGTIGGTGSLDSGGNESRALLMIKN
jgi:hypothetical protein